MNLALFIEELLWEHDCVVVPGWGGFVANYQSAQINPLTHEIKPPSRQLGFNKHLTQQDGLLQSHISKSLGISMSSAQDEIQNWVREHQSKLSNGDKIMLPHLGLIALDPAGQIQFIPDETGTFLKSSFGLPSISLELKQPHKLIRPSQSSKDSDFKKWIAAAGIALTIGMGLFAMQKSLHHTDMAGWGLSKENAISEYIPHLPEIPVAKYSLPTLESLNNLASTLQNSESKDESAPVISLKKTSREKIKKSPKNTSWVVGGVFASKDNAQNKLSRIQGLGFSDAKIVVLDNKYYVCYGETNSEKESFQLRQRVVKVDPFAWTKR